VTRLRISFLGTRGVPARYGGFETAAEEIGRRLVDLGHAVTVYCRGGDRDVRSYLGMDLVHLPAIRRRSLETLSHTAISTFHADCHRPDVAVLFNAANFPMIPVLHARHIPVAVHVDGLEWKRSKWGPTGKRWYLAAERQTARWADALIADAQGIRDYYRENYAVDAHLISYGAPILRAVGTDRLATVGVEAHLYHLVVARFEPENHVHMIVEGYSKSASSIPLIVVGGSPYNAAYGEEIRRLASGDPRIRLIGPVWDQALLDQLYANATSYLHGHSVGGTNPSLLRAMGAAAPVLAFDVTFNREVAGDCARFFGSPADVAGLVEAVEREPEDTRLLGKLGQDRVASLYRWDDVAARYALLCQSLVEEQAARGGAREPD